jgi:hypothetical protein
VIPIPLLVVGAAAAALAGTTVTGEIRLRRTGYRPWRTAPLVGGDHQFAPDSSSTFRGAGAHPPVRLSGPGTVRLQLDSGWAHLRGTGGMIDVWIPRERITEVRLVRLPTSTALRFLSPSGDYDGVLFFSFSPTSLSVSLRAHGWPVADPRR